MGEIIRYVLHGGLHVPPERADGADPIKLQDQFNEYRNDLSEIPPLEAVEAAGGALVAMNGVTRAARSHMVDPERAVPVIVTSSYPNAEVSHLPTIEQLLTHDF